jgi:hypothetical protein
VHAYGMANVTERIVTQDGRPVASYVSMRGGDLVVIRREQVKAFITEEEKQHEVWPVVRSRDRWSRIGFADCSVTQLGNLRPWLLVMRTQITLEQAWAVTIHKALA